MCRREPRNILLLLLLPPVSIYTMSLRRLRRLQKYSSATRRFRNRPIRYRGPRFYHYRESTYVFYLASTRLETWRFPDNRRINPNRRYRSRSPLLAEIPHTASLVSPLRPISISRATSSSRNLFNLYSSFLYLPLLTSFARHFLVYLVYSILSSISITMKFYNVYFRELSHFLLIYNSYWNFFQKSEAITTAWLAKFFGK